MGQAGQLGLVVGMVAACAALNLARASFYRARRGTAQKAAPDRSRAVPARALNPAARAAVIEVLHRQRFADLSVREVYAALHDEGRYLCSTAAMYRLLRALGESRERRAQRRHPRYPVTLRQQQPIVPGVLYQTVASSPTAAANWSATSCRSPWAGPAAATGCPGCKR